MSSLQGCPHYRGVLTTEVSSLQRCPHYRGVLTTGVSSLQRCPHYRGVLTTGVSLLQRCPCYRGVLTTEVSCVCTVITYNYIIYIIIHILIHIPYIGLVCISHIVRNIIVLHLCTVYCVPVLGSSTIRRRVSDFSRRRV